MRVLTDELCPKVAFSDPVMAAEVASEFANTVRDDVLLSSGDSHL